MNVLGLKRGENVIHLAPRWNERVVLWRQKGSLEVVSDARISETAVFPLKYPDFYPNFLKIA